MKRLTRATRRIAVALTLLAPTVALLAAPPAQAAVPAPKNLRVCFKVLDYKHDGIYVPRGSTATVIARAIKKNGRCDLKDDLYPHHPWSRTTCRTFTAGYLGHPWPALARELRHGYCTAYGPSGSPFQHMIFDVKRTSGGRYDITTRPIGNAWPVPSPPSPPSPRPAGIPA